MFSQVSASGRAIGATRLGTRVAHILGTMRFSALYRGELGRLQSDLYLLSMVELKTHWGDHKPPSTVEAESG